MKPASDRVSLNTTPVATPTSPFGSLLVLEIRRVLRKGCSTYFLTFSSICDLSGPPPQEKRSEKNKTCFIADEQIPWPRYTTRIIMQKKGPLFFFSDDFGLRSRVTQNPFQTKKKVYLYRCICQKSIFRSMKFSCP